METIESKTSRAVLEQPIATIDVGGKIYRVSPPTIGTLIMASEIISTLPEMPRHEDNVNEEVVLNESMMMAKEYKRIGYLMAVLILGAKEVRRSNRITDRINRIIGIIPALRVRSSVERLSERVMDNIGSKDLMSLIVDILSGMEIASFFALTTSLSKINMIRPTR